MQLIEIVGSEEFARFQAARAQQKIHFWKNASLLGGLLLVAFD